MKKKFLLAAFFAIFCSLSVSAQFAKQLPIEGKGMNSEQYRSFTFDGAWCWYADPRAVYYKGKKSCTYVTWIDHYGSIFISSYNHDNGNQKTTLIDKFFEADDHDVPAILIDKDGYITLFYSRHSDKQGTRMVKSLKPESIDEWGKIRMLSLNDMSVASLKSTSYTYCHPVQLKDDNNNIYIYWRGMNFKPTMSVSQDNGKTWSKGKIVFAPRGINKNGRPYMKVYSDGNKKIHFIMTDGHPRDEKTNNIYYFNYTKDGYHSVDGSKIELDKDGVLTSKSVDLVYDGSTKGKAWVWDVAQDKKGNPVIAYVRFPDDNHHIYCYATWNGKKWVIDELIDSGKWFPQTPVADFEKEPNYSAGLCIDKEDPSIVYLSAKRDKFFEIEKWQKGRKGWSVEAITKNSTKNNVRPYAVVGAGEKNELQLFWMQNTYYHKFGTPFFFLGYSDKHYLTSIKSNLNQSVVTNPLDSAQIVNKMIDVAQWQLSILETKAHADRRDWIWGAFYVGLVELYKRTNDSRFLAELEGMGHTRNWTLLHDHFHADRLTVADAWLSVADITGDKDILKDVDLRLSSHLARGFKGIMLQRKAGAWKWWSWCDALFMAPPTFAHAATTLKQPRYLDYMDKAWKKTADYLYSKEDSLFYRDDTFFGKKTPYGNKVFWGRGNGWVIGGLVRVMNYMPKDSKYRPYYENQFKEMMAKLLTVQQSDGLWPASLLDPKDKELSETSGSAFFLYGLLWGINNGLIDAKYTDVAIKGWKTLVSRVDKRGCLGYVQKVAAAPGGFKPGDWQLYASGAFILAGEQMIELQKKSKK